MCYAPEWRVVRFGNEVHGAPRHVGCLGILLGNPRQLAGVPHRPAGGERIAFALRRVRPVVPRIVAAIALIVASRCP